MAKRRTKVDPINKSIKKHAAEDTVFEGGQQDLPPGINNGIARITKGDVKPYNDNSGLRLYVAATVVEPQEVTWAPKVFKDGKVQTLKPTTRKVYGGTTKQILPLCDRGNRDQDENIDRAFQFLRAWGCSTEGVETVEDLEEAIANWVEEGPYIRFRTSSRDPNKDNPQEGAWENWDGVTEYDEEDADDGVEEEEADGEETEDMEDEEEDEEEDVADEEEEDTEDDDTEEDEDTEDEEEDDDDDEYEDVDIVPEKEDNYYYKPPKKRKRVLCEVTAVFKGKETCNLKNTEDGKTAYRGVKWSDLYEEEE